jgi:hypothetical protein
MGSLTKVGGCSTVSSKGGATTLRRPVATVVVVNRREGRCQAVSKQGENADVV